ncbi:CDP-glycerol glycerophosphotransferase family protein [Endozoicomonas euniceicola]|uniref:CDP-glycerol glycerophosphotransferase family protein n=1 Tax=Endozoicomonas euniceicola TaxID=1234143 RepID=A0ABY6GUI5_9GAMM|nr:CDP-glycerol glycerophosphotransferase family protein [Endozoicomonas euniceicola]UYM15703.1 CDP-glycerol glycerophosphotransferase family protein [Endozoicomonas euniceicola]
MHAVISFFLNYICLFLSRKNIWVINSYKNCKFNFNSRVFFEYLVRYKSEKVLFVIDDDSLRESLKSEFGDYFITTKKISHLLIIHRARVWITSTRPVFIYPLFNINRIVVNLWHGTPIKKIALEDNAVSYLRKIMYKYYYARIYDFICASSEDVANVLAKSFNVKKEKVIVTGSLIGQMFNQSISSKTNLIVDSTVDSKQFNILYAPTYRDGGSTRYFPFDDVNINELNDFLLANNIVVYLRPHHLDNGYKDFTVVDNVRLFDSTLVPEVSFYLNRFDMLVTDYSSIAIDFLLTDKNIIYIPYDLDGYKQSRGLNYEFDDVSPGPKVSDFSEWKNEVLNLMGNDQPFLLDEYENIKKRFHQHTDGQCDIVYKKINDIKISVCN